MPDAWPNAYHDGWFLDAGADAQRAVWDSFHDALAAVHRVDLDALDRRVRRPARHARSARLLARRAARRRRARRRSRDTSRCSTGCAPTCPPSADAPPAFCMGDARLVNAIVDGARSRRWSTSRSRTSATRSADVAYSLFLERSHAHTDAVAGSAVGGRRRGRGGARRPVARSSISTTGWRSAPRSSWSPRAAPSAMWGPPGSFSEDHAGAAPAVGVRRARRQAREHRRARAPVRPVGVVVERVVVLLVDRPRRRSGGVLPPRAAPQPGAGADLVVRVPRRHLVRHRGDPPPLRRLRPRRRHGVRPLRAAVRVARRATTGGDASRTTGIVREVTGPGAGGFVPLALDLARDADDRGRTARAPATTWAASSTRRAGSSSRWASPARCASATRRARCAPPGTATGRGVRATGG